MLERERDRQEMGLWFACEKRLCVRNQRESCKALDERRFGPAAADAAAANRSCSSSLQAHHQNNHLEQHQPHVRGRKGRPFGPPVVQVVAQDPVPNAKLELLQRATRAAAAATPRTATTRTTPTVVVA